MKKRIKKRTKKATKEGRKEGKKKERKKVPPPCFDNGRKYGRKDEGR